MVVNVMFVDGPNLTLESQSEILYSEKKLWRLKHRRVTNGRPSISDPDLTVKPLGFLGSGFS